MKSCPKCHNKHDKPGTYCSRSCANSRKFSKETRLKKSISNKNHWKSLPEEKRDELIDGLNSVRHINQGMCFERLIESEWNPLSYGSKRRRVILEQKGRCNRCGIDKWLEERITLEIDHKDGDNGNNNRGNLEGLCPNCHSLTPTWRGKKNKTSTRNKIIVRDLKLLEEIS